MLSLFQRISILTILVIMSAVHASAQEKLAHVEASTLTTATISNDGFILKFKEIPERAVTLNQTQTEIMLALGLADHMVGTAYLDDKILPEFAEIYRTIPILAKKYPSKEILLNVAPDFIYAGYPSAFSDRRGMPTRHELLDMGINFYLAPITCKGMVTGKSPWSMAILYKELREVAKIFRVEARAEQLIATMEKEISRIQREQAPDDQKPWILWLDYFSNQGPFVGSGSGPIHAIITLAGGKNSFSDTLIGKTLATVNQEEIISRPIDYIVLTEAVWSSSAKKRKTLDKDPIYSQLVAVKNKKYVDIEFSASTGGIRTVSAIKKLAAALKRQ